MITAILIVFLLYAILILWIEAGIKKIEPVTRPNNDNASCIETKISLVIPFRNEEKNLYRLLKSINQQSIDKKCFEVILVNDHSEDHSLEVIKKITTKFSLDNVKTVHLTSSKRGKKEAIRYGIHEAKNALIVQADADCLFHSKWLEYIVEIFRYKSQGLAILPVFVQNTKSKVGLLDRLDYSSLQAVGIGMAANGFPILCSGANLAYSKHDFLRANEIRNDLDIHSGDDIFLLQACIELNIPVFTALQPELVVQTQACPTLRSFLNQRRRWAKKNIRISDPVYFLVGLLALGANMGIIYSLFSIPEWLVVLLLCKMWVDGQLLQNFYVRCNEKFSLIPYILFALFYPFYLVYVSLSSIWQNSEWKGRLVKQ